MNHSLALHETPLIVMYPAFSASTNTTLVTACLEACRRVEVPKVRFLADTYVLARTHGIDQGLIVAVEEQRVRVVGESELGPACTISTAIKI